MILKCFLCITQIGHTVPVLSCKWTLGLFITLLNRKPILFSTNTPFLTKQQINLKQHTTNIETVKIWKNECQIKTTQWKQKLVCNNNNKGKKWQPPTQNKQKASKRRAEKIQ